jgi:hypothetical protein
MTTFIVILILAALAVGIYFFFKEKPKKNPIKVNTPTDWNITSGSCVTSGPAKPLGKIEKSEPVKVESPSVIVNTAAGEIKLDSIEAVKEEPKSETKKKKTYRKKDPKKPGAKRGRKPKNNNGNDQLLLS